ncbi:tRNA pseudouridine(38-40) synthase TruA [Nocardioides marmoriginsengisoli]|uniref:tRNA pseudouridine synthase A n=1 Tax=Nocardioides marmoriginsengisoli TaxID=661483 RepID=A0A3N0CDQ3_9ACTN|nr:tRNA pseudouridine(38-40) synthase TruA [Nocardioides marmoriginsengisoli]RNL61186.1 tRNA pseudouridine(38-40) synthase TruA [Nocardioides marmoriginsengisoli]
MRIRLDLAYDGTDFRGWAKQPGLRTVQGELEAALDTVLRTTGSAVTVAGRTDTGVHARGQVAHLDLEEDQLATLVSRGHATATEMLVRRLNGCLDPDLRLHRAAEAPAGFDARFSAVWRRYAYRIADVPDLVDPLQRHHVVAWERRLDVDAMNEASGSLIGLNDFAAFCRKRPGATTIRSLIELEWERIDGIVTASVRADAFCHSMVRSLVGCVTAVGVGRQRPEWVAQVLAAKVRDPAVAVAPAHGLTLEEVGYPTDSELAAQAEGARRRRELP